MPSSDGPRPPPSVTDMAHARDASATRIVAKRTSCPLACLLLTLWAMHFVLGAVPQPVCYERK